MTLKVDMAGPSSEAVGLIVGTGTATVAAVWAAIGYTARRFMAQQSSNHQDTRQLVVDVRDIKTELPKLATRVGRVEWALVGAGAAVATIFYRKH